MVEGVSPYAPTSDEEPLTLPSPSRGEGMLGEIAALPMVARNDSCDLRAPLHLRVEKVLVFQLDAADRAGDRLARRGRDDFFLLQDPLADVVEVASGMLLVQGIQDVGQHHSRSLQTCSPFFQ